MICEGCRPAHAAADCVDTQAGRLYPHRHCVCQHEPRAAGAVALPSAAEVQQGGRDDG